MTTYIRGHVVLIGEDHDVWSDSKHRKDLIALEPPNIDDGFTSEFTLKLVHLYNEVIGRHIHVSVPSFSSIA